MLLEYFEYFANFVAIISQNFGLDKFDVIVLYHNYWNPMFYKAL